MHRLALRRRHRTITTAVCSRMAARGILGERYVSCRQFRLRPRSDFRIQVTAAPLRSRYHLRQQRGRRLWALQPSSFPTQARPFQPRLSRQTKVKAAEMIRVPPRVARRKPTRRRTLEPLKKPPCAEGFPSRSVFRAMRIARRKILVSRSSTASRETLTQLTFGLRTP